MSSISGQNDPEKKRGNNLHERPNCHSIKRPYEAKPGPGLGLPTAILLLLSKDIDPLVFQLRVLREGESLNCVSVVDISENRNTSL